MKYKDVLRRADVFWLWTQLLLSWFFGRCPLLYFEINFESSRCVKQLLRPPRTSHCLDWAIIQGGGAGGGLIQATVGCLINVKLELHAYFRVPFHFDWSSTPVQPPLCSVSVPICHTCPVDGWSRRRAFPWNLITSAKVVTLEINSVAASLHATVDANVSTTSAWLTSRMIWHWSH